MELQVINWWWHAINNLIGVVNADRSAYPARHQLRQALLRTPVNAYTAVVIMQLREDFDIK